MEATLETQEAALPGPSDRRSSVRLEKTTLHERINREGLYLLLYSTVLGLSFAYPALKSRHLWPDIPCIFYKVTGVPCPACGLTRSFAFTARADFLQAFKMHLLGPLLFFAACALTCYFAVSTLTGYSIRYELSRRARRIILWAVVTTALACWVVKLSFFKASW